VAQIIDERGAVRAILPKESDGFDSWFACKPGNVEDAMEHEERS
jgi:hypothetical protein